MKNHLLPLLFITFFLHSCDQKTYECESFNYNTPILNYSLSPSLKDSILLFTEENEKLVLLKDYLKVTQDDEIKCSGTKVNCDCLSNYELIYAFDDLAVILRLDEYIDKKRNDSHYNYSLNVFGSYSTFYKRVDLDEIDSYENTLGVSSYELKGETYDNILEVATNTDSTAVEKFWIQKDKGIIKLWYKDKLWSVK